MSTIPPSSSWRWTGPPPATAGAVTNSPTAIERGRDWIVGLQSRNGGWGAFDVDNDYEYLNNIPFADHGALLDPPTADVTARCVSMLAQLGEGSAIRLAFRPHWRGRSPICAALRKRTGAGSGAGG